MPRPAVLWVLLAAGVACAVGSELPADAMRTGVPVLLSKKTASKWKAWRGPSLLAFYGRGKQSMGLKQLGKEYRGRLPIGGIRPDDTGLQQLFGVQPKELPTILVMQNGSPTMRLGGGSDPSTLRTLINSAIGSYSKSADGGRTSRTPSASNTAKVAASAMRQRCEQRKGVCVVLATSLATPRDTVDLLTKMLAGQNVVHVDSHDRQINALIKKAGPAAETKAPDAAVLVVKSRAGKLPRITRYTGPLNDRSQLARFFEELKAGLLSFDTFQWPVGHTTDSSENVDDATTRRNGGQTTGSAPESVDDKAGLHQPAPPRPASEQTSAQYAKIETSTIEEIVLDDDE